MMKHRSRLLRTAALGLLLTLALALAPAALAADSVTAKAGNIDLLFNGKAIQLGTYNIADSNYVKLRDVAQLLSGTEKSISVTWNGEESCIELIRGGIYQPVGGELAPLAGGSQSASPSTAQLLLDGRGVDLTAYNIGGNNFFKLRDLGSMLDFYVGWDGSTNTVIVDTSQGYPSLGADCSDAELLAFAQEAAEDMIYMVFSLDCYGILDYDENETISVVLPDGSPEYPWIYYRVPGYTSMWEIQEAIEDTWYEKFSRKYDSLEWLGRGGNLDIYLWEDDKMYVQDGALGIGPFVYVVDGMISRTETEAKFSGQVLLYGEEYEGTFEMSLVYEDGAWKYGYFSDESNGWANPNCLDEHLIWMAENAADRMFDWRLDAELGWFFATDWENDSIEYANWYYSRVIGYSSAAEARAAMEEEWYRHFSRRYTIEQVMGENSNFTNTHIPYFVDLNGDVYMPECQWGGTVLSFRVDQIVSRTADEVIFRGIGVDRESPDDSWQVSVEFSLVFEDGVWKYGYYKQI